MKYVFFLLILSVTVSCKYGEKFKSFQGRTFSIEYAPYLKKSIGVHPSAPFQAKNEYRDIYMFVDDIPKKGDFLVLCDSIKNDLLQNLIDPLEERSLFLEDSTVFHLTTTGTINDKRLVFNVIMHKGAYNNYHASAWLFRSKREMWEEDLIKSMLTIQETGLRELY